MKRRNFIQLLGALVGVPLLPKVAAHTLSIHELPSHNTHSFPIGYVKQFTGYLPKGWLPCDGRIISRLQYNTLYSALGNNYGEGDGMTTFRIPDMNTVHVHGIRDPGHSHGRDMLAYIIKAKDE